MNHPLQCRCGTVKGYVSPPDMAQRAVCYCNDCQAFAHFLKRSQAVLDELGGTEIVATLPKHVHFTQGIDALACMSLSGRGLLRWYAACCDTPIGNTPRDRKTSYVGLVHSCLTSNQPSLDDSFGPLRMVLKTKSATGEVIPTPYRSFVAILKIMKAVIGARLAGAYKTNSFFVEPSGDPIEQPRVLTKAERARLTRAD
ncbi:MAG: DUF6151 family protein [Betaproteobacteria bacterium]